MFWGCIGMSLCVCSHFAEVVEYLAKGEAGRTYRLVSYNSKNTSGGLSEQMGNSGGRLRV